MAMKRSSHARDAQSSSQASTKSSEPLLTPGLGKRQKQLMERREECIRLEKQRKDENLEYARCALFASLNAPHSSTAQGMGTPAAELAVAPVPKVRTSKTKTGRLQKDKDLEDLERRRCELFADANKQFFASAGQAPAASESSICEIAPASSDLEATTKNDDGG
jgi:hypothetical protein